MGRSRERRVRGRSRSAAVVCVAVLVLSACGSPAGSDDGPDSPRPSPSGSTAATSVPTATPTATPSATPTPTPSPSSRSSARPSPQPSEAAPLIVIDPGHSGKSTRGRATHGLRDIDYPNFPEIYEMFDVSVCVAQALRADGYRVRLTKDSVLDSVSHTERAAVANDHEAALAVSVHDDHGAPTSFQHTYDQRGTQRRDGTYPQLYRGTGSHRTVFDDPAVAKKSQAYARIIADARTEAQRHRTTVAQNSFNGRAPLEPGNLALVQLFSEVPWVYNELGALTDGDPTRAISIDSETGYAAGLLTGIERAVPLPAGPSSPSTDSTSTLRSCLVNRVEPTPGELTRPRRYLPDGFD